MKLYYGIAMTDGTNKYKQFFPFKTITDLYHNEWKQTFPVGYNHDHTKLIGVGQLSGIYFEPGKAYITNKTFAIENDKDKEKLLPKIDKWKENIYINKNSDSLNTLEHLLEGKLSKNRKIAPIQASAFIDEKIIFRVFPKLADLLDDDGLIELQNLTPVLPGVYKKDSFLIFASSYLRRNCSICNSLNKDFLHKLQEASLISNLKVKVRLDFDLIGLAGTEKEEFEYSYWWGPKFTNELEEIDIGVTKYINENRNARIDGLDFTEFGWHYQDGNKTLEIEEVIDVPNIYENNQELYGCRYIHSFINPETNTPAHLDGAIRAYTDEKILNRIDVNFDKTGRDTKYTKLWRIDGEIPVDKWKELITHYYRDNKLIGEYFKGEDENQKDFEPRMIDNYDNIPINFNKYIPVNINHGNGLRVYYYFDEAFNDFKYDIDIKTTEFIYHGSSNLQKVMEFETITILKLLQRKGCKVRFPRVKCICYEDTIFNFPIFQCNNSQSVIELQSSLIEIFEAMINKMDDDRLISYSFQFNINDKESVTISIAGHILDFIDIIKPILNSFEISSYDTWISQLYECNNTFKSHIIPPYSLINEKQLKFKKSIVPPNIIKKTEIIKNAAYATLYLPVEDLQMMNKNNISIAPCYLIEESKCKKCGCNYMNCNCIKFIDDCTGHSPKSPKLLFYEWTNRHA